MISINLRECDRSGPRIPIPPGTLPRQPILCRKQQTHNARMRPIIISEDNRPIFTKIPEFGRKMKADLTRFLSLLANFSLGAKLSVSK